MSKLIYRTSPPKKGRIFNEAFSTHQSTGSRDTFPPDQTQTDAMRIVQDRLREMIAELEKLGYDPTKARFQIHFKD